MSTSDKLTYLNTTKTKIKDAINLTGADITNDTFRQYSTKLYDSYLDIIKNGTGALYDNMPKVTGSGSELSLQNTADAPMVLELGASDTTQKTTTGKNIANISSLQVGKAWNGDSNTSRATIVGIEASPNTNYALSGDISSNSHLTTLRAITYNSSNTGVTTAIHPTDNGYVNFTTTSSTNRLSIEVLADTTITSDMIANIIIQLELGTKTDYEPYTGKEPSPSPDYPQDVNVVTGNNTIEVNSMNILEITLTTTTQNGVTVTVNDDDTITINGRPTTLTIFKIGEISLNKDETYTLTGGLSTSSYRLDMRPLNNPTASIYNGWVSSPNTPADNKPTYTMTENVTLGCYLRLSEITTYNNVTIRPMIQIGNISQIRQTYSLTLGSLELAKIGDYEDKIFNNVPSSPLYDSSLVEGGWYKHKVIYKDILDGTETWSMPITNLFEVHRKYGEFPFVPLFGKSNYYIYNPVQSGIDAATKNGEFALQNYGGDYNLFIKNIDYSNVQDFESHLQQLYADDKPVLIYFPLENPVNEPITDTTLVSQLEALKNATSYDDETNISQTNANRPFIISASAIKNSMESA